MTTWADVQVGDWVRGKDGHLWAVTRHRVSPSGQHLWTMERKGRDAFTVERAPHLEAPEISRTAQEMADTAVANVEQILGGKVLHATPAADGPQVYACPPEFTDPGTFLAHLSLLHGVDVSTLGEAEQTLSALKARHDKSHVEQGPGYLRHQHTPDYLKVNRV